MFRDLHDYQLAALYLNFLNFDCLTSEIILEISYLATIVSYLLERQVRTRSFPRRMVMQRNTELFLPNYPQLNLHVYKYSGYKFITAILLSRQHIPSTATRSNNFLFFLKLSPFFRAPLRVEDTPHTPEKFKARAS